MGQDESDRAEPPGSAPERFDDFYLREYPAVVGLLQSLLRVVALSVVLVRVASNRQGLAPAGPTATATTVVPGTTVPAPMATLPPASVPATTSPAGTRVPEECLDAAELADEIIARLNRNQRDNALALDLRDYSVASQACRREAGR